MTEFNEELKKALRSATAWEVAFAALDTAIKESAATGVLQPSDQEVLMLREFTHNMQEREASAIAALNAVRKHLS